MFHQNLTEGTLFITGTNTIKAAERLVRSLANGTLFFCRACFGLIKQKSIYSGFVVQVRRSHAWPAYGIRGGDQVRT